MVIDESLTETQPPNINIYREVFKYHCLSSAENTLEFFNFEGFSKYSSTFLDSVLEHACFWSLERSLINPQCNNERNSLFSRGSSHQKGFNENIALRS